MELTLQEVREKEATVKALDEELEEAFIQQQEARAAGDLKENEEYRTVTSKIKELQSKKNKLVEQLSDYTLVKPERGPRIVLGDTVCVHKVNMQGAAVSEEIIMTLSSEGDVINAMKLSIESPLGKAILNGTDGVYAVQAPGGVIHYHVKKII